MILAASAVLALAARCAPAAAPETLLALAWAESGLDPLAIGVNRGGSRPPPARSPAEAADRAAALIARGANVDLGLTQINSANLVRLGLTVPGAFDPCRNLAAGAVVLQAGYVAARPAAPGDQAALRTALSLYNTGDPQRGFRTGYVARVQAAAEQWHASASAQTAREPRAPRTSTAAAWDVFGDLRAATFVTPYPSDLEGAAP